MKKKAYDFNKPGKKNAHQQDEEGELDAGVEASQHDAPSVEPSADVSSSLHAPTRQSEWNANATRGDGSQVVVPVLSLQNTLASIREDVFFLKTDMQGADFGAVSALDRFHLRRLAFLATEVWAEGALGKVHLEIQSIRLDAAASSASLARV